MNFGFAGTKYTACDIEVSILQRYLYVMKCEFY